MEWNRTKLNLQAGYQFHYKRTVHMMGVLRVIFLIIILRITQTLAVEFTKKCRIAEGSVECPSSLDFPGEYSVGSINLSVKRLILQGRIRASTSVLLNEVPNIEFISFRENSFKQDQHCEIFQGNQRLLKIEKHKLNGQVETYYCPPSKSSVMMNSQTASATSSLTPSPTINRQMTFTTTSSQTASTTSSLMPTTTINRQMLSTVDSNPFHPSSHSTPSTAHSTPSTAHSFLSGKPANPRLHSPSLSTIFSHTSLRTISNITKMNTTSFPFITRHLEVHCETYLYVIIVLAVLLFISLPVLIYFVSIICKRRKHVPPRSSDRILPSKEEVNLTNIISNPIANFNYDNVDDYDDDLLYETPKSKHGSTNQESTDL